MPKTIIDAPLTTREARRRLKTGLYWRSVDTEIHLGYRKGKRAGVWLVRWRNGKGYRQVPLGPADDVVSIGALDYRAALKGAREAVEAARTELLATLDGPLLTVRLAVNAYVDERNTRETRRAGRPTLSDASRRLEKYVTGRPQRGNRKLLASAPLANIALHQLSERHLRDWRDGLPADLKATGIQRLVNDLKASLNSTYERHRERLPATLPGVIKSGLKAASFDEDEGVPLARENQILSDAQIGALLKAAHELDGEQNWEGDLFRLLLVMASTGARFSQVIRLKVNDVQCAACRIMMPPSRKGRGAKSGPTPVPVGQDVLDALAPVLTGRSKSSLLLERWRSVQEAGSIRWQRAGRGGWQTPSEIVRPWHAVRDKVHLPDAVPYALRHSSIVRAIRANLPLRLVAAIHDTSVAMIERHYARYIADGLDVLAAQAVVPMVPIDAARKHGGGRSARSPGVS